MSYAGRRYHHGHSVGRRPSPSISRTMGAQRESRWDQCFALSTISCPEECHKTRTLSVSDFMFLTIDILRSFFSLMALGNLLPFFPPQTRIPFLISLALHISVPIYLAVSRLIPRPHSLSRPTCLRPSRIRPLPRMHRSRRRYLHFTRHLAISHKKPPCPRENDASARRCLG